MNQSEEKILVFCSREICYCSGNFFANRIAEAFEALGYPTEVCEFAGSDDLDRIFMPYIGKAYKLILDFNSRMTRMEEEDGTPVPDRMEGPFFDYVLDHPLFHYNSLTPGLKNLNAVVLDEAQKRYVDRYYPGVRKTLMMPLGATEALSYEKRSGRADGVLFMGTYDDPDSVYEIVRASPKPLRTYMDRLIEMRLSDPLLPMEEGFAALLKEEGRRLSDGEFALFMNAMYPVDAYIRDYFRKSAIDALGRRHIPVRLAGEGWDKYKGVEERFLIREKAVDFGFSFEKIAKEHILLNSSPIFNRGAHDRIFAGMANHCVVLTDENPYLRRILRDGGQVMLYSIREAESLCDKAEELLCNPALVKSVEEAAYQEYLRCHTWKHRAKELLDFIS